MSRLIFKIVTPEKLVLQEEADQVSLPTPSGEITILQNHMPLVSMLSAGEIILKRDGLEIPLATSGGFLKVSNNEVTDRKSVV